MTNATKTNDRAGMTELKFTTTTKGGTRAYRYEHMQWRWFPIGFKKACAMIQSGEAYDNTAYHAAEAVKLARLTREMHARSAQNSIGVTLRIVK